MAVHFVFEDGNNTPSSLLLKQSHFGNNIHFSDGCSNIYAKACSI